MQCAQYWPEPNKAAIYGRFLVHHKGVNQNGVFTTRTFLMQHLDQPQTQRTIAHIEFSAWPDRGCIECHTIIDLIRLVRQTRQTRSSECPGPVITHCSAGVGRTGAFLACDITLYRVQQSQPANIRQTVFNLRRQRTKMVMTVEQYALIHSVAKEAQKFGRENSTKESGNCGMEVLQSKLQRASLEVRPQVASIDL